MNRPFYSALDPFCSTRAPDDALFTLDHFYAKLFTTAATMQTAAGRAEAEERVGVMQRSLAELGEELGELEMQDIDTYITRTESAVRKLFEGIESYIELLRPMKGMTFITSNPDPVQRRAELDAWIEQNEDAYRASKEARLKFSDENFAMATLCGAVLQIAAKAIECYSKNQAVPKEFRKIIGNNAKVILFCIGRQLRDVPIGLIILAGRNQHTHFNEPELKPINAGVLDYLATHFGTYPQKDPAFDVSNPLLVSCASNITAILGWRSYAAYVSDLRDMLKY